MMHRLLVTTVCLLVMPVVASASMSDVSCDDSGRLHRMLRDVLGAERQGIGLRDPETVLEIWIEHKSGDWMIVQKYTNGTSCIVAMGEYWENISPEPA